MSSPNLEGPLAARLAEVERQMITEAMARCRGNMARAARELGITERIMSLRMKKYGISYQMFRATEQPVKMR